MKKQMTMVEAVNEWLKEPFLSEPQRQFYKMYLENEGHKKIVIAKVRQLGSATFKKWLDEMARKITNETEKETCRHPQGFTDVNPFAALPPELRCQICWELKITNNE